MVARRKKHRAAGPKRWPIFVSHSSTDTWVARQIAWHLGEAGADPFLDEAHIAVGEDFEERLKAALLEARELLVLLTPWSLQRPYIWGEVGAVWVRGVPIVSVLHGLTTEELLAQETVPIMIKRRTLIDINDLDRYFEELGGRAAREA